MSRTTLYARRAIRVVSKLTLYSLAAAGLVLVTFIGVSIAVQPGVSGRAPLEGDAVVIDQTDNVDPASAYPQPLLSAIFLKARVPAQTEDSDASTDEFDKVTLPSPAAVSQFLRELEHRSLLGSDIRDDLRALGTLYVSDTNGACAASRREIGVALLTLASQRNVDHALVGCTLILSRRLASAHGPHPVDALFMDRFQDYAFTAYARTDAVKPAVAMYNLAATRYGLLSF